MATEDEIQETMRRMKVLKAAQALDAEKTRTAPATSVVPGTSSSDPVDGRSLGRIIWDAPEDFSGGLAAGVVRGIAGPIQAGMDLVAPETSTAMTGRVNRFADPLTKSTMGSAGELVGEILPFMISGPGQGILKGTTVIGRGMKDAVIGALSGATSFQGAEDRGERTEGRQNAAIVGGGLGGTVGTLISAGTKIANSRATKALVDDIKSAYSELDPAMSEVWTKLRGLAERGSVAWEDATRRLKTIGDRFGNYNFAPISDRVSGLLEKLDNAPAKHSPTQQVFERAINTILPVGETEITVLGKKFTRTPEGKYVDEAGNPMPARVASALPQQKSFSVKYSTAQEVLNDIDAHLKKDKGGSPTQTEALKELRATIADHFDSLKPERLKRFEEHATELHETGVKPFTGEGMEKILTGKDSLERSQAILDVALGENTKAAQTLAGVLGPSGRRQVQVGAMQRALAEATDEKTGVLDPAKFQAFFKKKQNLAGFIDKDGEQQIAGVANLLTDTAQRQGESAGVKLPHPGAWLALPGLYHMMNNPAQGAAMIGASLTVGPLFKKIESMLNDGYGRRILAAAALAKPGSPRMARIMQAADQRFLPVAAGKAVGDYMDDSTP